MLLPLIIMLHFPEYFCWFLISLSLTYTHSYLSVCLSICLRHSWLYTDFFFLSELPWLFGKACVMISCPSSRLSVTKGYHLTHIWEKGIDVFLKSIGVKPMSQTIIELDTSFIFCANNCYTTCIHQHLYMVQINCELIHFL